MSDSSEREWAEKEVAAELRASESDRRDRRADERDRLANDREDLADQRDDTADDREATLDAWERRLTVWERALEQRQKDLDDQAALEAGTLTQLVEASHTAITHAFEVLQRARDAVGRVEALQARVAGRDDREQAEVDRQVRRSALANTLGDDRRA